jgi:hypothetical protein
MLKQLAKKYVANINSHITSTKYEHDLSQLDMKVEVKNGKSCFSLINVLLSQRTHLSEIYFVFPS